SQDKTGRSEDCLSPSQMGEFRSAGFGREAQGTPCDSKGQVVGCLFLWFVSFGQAKEMNASVRRRAHQKQSARKRTIARQDQKARASRRIGLQAISPRYPTNPVA
ncbi:MAG: hypothetical protein WBM58_20505, partial [Sedimenticolaceae bacterium]